MFDAAYLQYGLKEHRWFDIKGAGWRHQHPDRPLDRGDRYSLCRTGDEIELQPAIGKSTFAVPVKRRRVLDFYFSSWGVLKEKPELNKPNFFPVNIIRATRNKMGVYDLFQEVTGIPQPTFTEQELQDIKKLRLKQQFDKKVEDFQMIVIPPQLPLESLLFYTGADGNRQPIKTDAHRQLKREQSLKAMQKAMGQLPDRPRRTSLEGLQHSDDEHPSKEVAIPRSIFIMTLLKVRLCMPFLYEPLGPPAGRETAWHYRPSPDGEIW